ncbi:hypothetical protein SO802_000683 [Lithocarpus litseifolius]|uniref:Uncharacterized protein n=1 Tax=Lithocarpus litseifolius TaxID=425828 RepID=A0AAW2DVZ6_9ROSI
MGTEILLSHDCLQDRFRKEALTLTPTLKTHRNANPNPNGANSRRRKRSPMKIQSSKDRSDRFMVAKSPSQNLVMGEVKILKRGEALTQPKTKTKTDFGSTLAGADNRKPKSKSKGGDVEVSDLGLGSTDRLGPDPETVQKQIRVNAVDGIYAGSAFVTSPPPSSLPVPGFLGKNGPATSDLRRLLGLD